MDPPTIRHSVATVSRSKLAFWAAALGGGAYLGYGIAYSLTLLGMAAFGALFAGFVAVSILAILIVVAAVAALLPDRRGRQAARTVIVAAVLLAAGVGIGWAITPVLGLGYRQPVVVEASGTVNLSLDGIEGYAGRGDVLAHCRSEQDTMDVAWVEANAAGEIGTSMVNTSLSVFPDVDGIRPEVQVSVQPAVKAEGAAPMWLGSADMVEGINGDRHGRIVFTEAALAGDETGGQPAGWPVVVSGTLSWSCGEWIRPDG